MFVGGLAPCPSIFGGRLAVNARLRGRSLSGLRPRAVRDSLRLKEDLSLFPRRIELACTRYYSERKLEAALQSACMIDELTFLAALTCLHLAIRSVIRRLISK